MSTLVTVAIIIIVVAVLVAKTMKSSSTQEPAGESKPIYFYGRKEEIMTPREVSFYRRLEAVASDRYYIFPQVHLSALLVNQTKGRYWKVAYQRINRTSVDYVLCDKQTMKAVYAVELDDSTHDSVKCIARDAGVEEMLASVGLPLVRFRDITNITDDEIARKFQEASVLN